MCRKVSLITESGSSVTDSCLANESAREEATGEAGEARRGSRKSKTWLPKAQHCAHQSPERVPEPGRVGLTPPTDRTDGQTGIATKLTTIFVRLDLYCFAFLFIHILRFDSQFFY